eukprot:CAMPEP_0113540062 /NCGR_PEP_ID=MMETSP0015_2-20120614/8271_1 /TAXON_ID=2838 /ORGANISM="Odontella" /LENGTH=434 /DNA_ID=CAMNT_0000439823 /DNA_START=401 /DNA_END=1705 /DNA_ORIENTATION=- /assembly_acc=CAM_ASM_000160
MSTSLTINFAEDLGPSPKIVHTPSGGDLVSHSNLFYESGGGGGGGCGGGRGGIPAPDRNDEWGRSGEAAEKAEAFAEEAASQHGKRSRRSSSSGNMMTDRLTQALLSRRDANNHGAWTFRRDAERDLLQHVENGLSISSSSSSPSSRSQQPAAQSSSSSSQSSQSPSARREALAESECAAASSILRSVDVYCLGKQWMYHVGHEKGEVIGPFVEKCVRSSSSSSSSGGGRPFVAVELGTYCGYSAILIARTVRKCAPSLNFKLYSIDINREYLEVARELVRMAKLEHYVTLIEFDPRSEKLSEVLTERIAADNNDDDDDDDDGDGDGEPEAEASKIDFLFLDHAKDRYLSDLNELEQADMIGRGSHVVADNVVVNSKELGGYREYVGGLARDGGDAVDKIAETDMIEGRLEYTENLKDGIEFTVYLKDPPRGQI